MIETWEVLLVEAETYMGRSITGPAVLHTAYGNADVELVRAWLVECVPWNALSRE